jgi:hypothetical protein
MNRATYTTTGTGCVVTYSKSTGNRLTATDPGTCTVIATRGTETGTASFTFTCLPLTVTAIAIRVGANRAEVAFTAPQSASQWTSFAAYAEKKGATVNTSSTTGTISVNGLDKNSGYTFILTATNAAGCKYTAQANRVLKW